MIIRHAVGACARSRSRIFCSTPSYRPARNGQDRQSSTVAQHGRPLRLAVIGSGPAGFYSAYKAMSMNEKVCVDMYEQLPVPFGLVRHGVAPDHPEVKNCQDKFTEVASSPRFTFVGNIDVGQTLPLSSLVPHYDALLFAYGASQDRTLGIPGESLTGIYSARAFVGWYNGLPEYRDLAPDLARGPEAIIIGQGNVALDVARILLSDLSRLRKTDITSAALAGLARSTIKRVRVVGRRGPMQASFTIKEARELLTLEDLSFSSIPEDLLPPPAHILPRPQKRMAQLLSKHSAIPPDPSAPKAWSLDCMRAPVSFNADAPASCLGSITFAHTAYAPSSDPFSPATPVVRDPTQTTTLPAQTAFRSIGYRSSPLPGMLELGIRFDTRSGTIPNDGYGRIVAAAGGVDGGVRQVRGMYCAGWVKRGPTGVIASTMADAFASAEAVVADLARPGAVSGERRGWDAVKEEVRKRGLRPVGWEGWLKIDAVERQRGRELGKEREKCVSVEEMLRILE